MPRPSLAEQLNINEDCDNHQVADRDLARGTLYTKLLQGNTLQLATALYTTMADPTRLRIISAINIEELCVCDLATILNLTESAISHQLRILRNSRVVKARQAGRRVYYSLADSHIKILNQQVIQHLLHKEVPFYREAGK